MFQFLRDALNEDDELLTSFYGMTIQPDPKYKKKLEKAIRTLGNKYLLAEPQPRHVQ